MCMFNTHTLSVIPSRESSRLRRKNNYFATMRESHFLDFRGSLQMKTLDL